MGPGISIAIAVAAVILVSVGLSLRAARTGGLERIVRCRSGHLFTSTVVPGWSFKSLRLGKVRFERCPVGRHWTLVGPVDESTLTPDEIAAARAHHDIRIP
jgi:hypothetical protein